MCFLGPGEDWGQRQGGDPPACPCWPLSQSPPQWCWESFPRAPSPVPGGCAHPCAGCLWRCPAGCAQTAQPCPQLWGGGEGWSCQHSMGPAPSSVSLSSLRVLRVGFGFQAENRCVFNHRWKEYTKLPSPERPLPASRLVCSCWDNRV